MKTQIETRNTELLAERNGTRSGEAPFAVNYQWSGSDGAIFHGHTVASGRDGAHAERRFFRRHRHVLRESGGTLIQALWVAVAGLVVTTTLAIVIAQLFRICALEKQVDGAHVRLDQLTVQVTQATARVQALEAQIGNRQPPIGNFPTNIILNRGVE
jgi:hypothetical protein